MTADNQHVPQVIAVTGGKGGVGKTNVTLNLGISLAKQGKRVLIFDADLSLANIDVMLGLTPKFNLSHVLNGENKLQDILLTGPAGIDIIPAGSGIKTMVELASQANANVITAFNELVDDYDVLLIDTSAGVSASVLDFSAAAQEILVVVCNEPTALTDAYALIKMLHRERNVYKFNIVANQVQSHAEGEQVYYKLLNVTDRFLHVQLDYIGVIPSDPLLKKAVKRQLAVVDAYPGSLSAKAFTLLANKIVQWPQSTICNGQLQFFLESLLAKQREVIS